MCVGTHRKEQLDMWNYFFSCMYTE